MNQVITLDGPAGSGKSTISRLLAEKLNFLYLDTGAMYRAVAFQAQRKKIDVNDRETLGTLCLNLDLKFKEDGKISKLFIGDEDISLAIRSSEMDMLSSTISAVKEVRIAMTGLQRKFGGKGRLVAEGRDMGTVVFPEADYKFFITASLKERAARRYGERKNRGESISRMEVENELRERDYQDETRPIAPLRPARDAKMIDTTTLTPEQVLENIFLSMNRKIIS